jgi:hypothetical protein
MRRERTTTRERARKATLSGERVWRRGFKSRRRRRAKSLSSRHPVARAT